MELSVKINEVKSIEELGNAWNKEDFKALLAQFEFPGAEELKPAELKDYLFMAIADFEPNEAAAILLEYKLADKLTEGQIENLSHEMLRAKTFENYSEIDLHHDLFNINQLLYKAYNGKFPPGTVNVVELEIQGNDNDPEEMTKETALKALSYGLSENNLINRLLSDQIEGQKPFPEAEGIVWELQNKGNHVYSLTISEKWLTKNEIEKQEYECTIQEYEEPEEGD